MKGLVQFTENGTVAEALSGVVQRVKSLIGGVDHGQTLAVQDPGVPRSVIAVAGAVTVAGFG